MPNKKNHNFIHIHPIFIQDVILHTLDGNVLTSHLLCGNQYSPALLSCTLLEKEKKKYSRFFFQQVIWDLPTRLWCIWKRLTCGEMSFPEVWCVRLVQRSVYKHQWLKYSVPSERVPTFGFSLSHLFTQFSPSSLLHLVKHVGVLSSGIKAPQKSYLFRLCIKTSWEWWRKSTMVERIHFRHQFHDQHFHLLVQAGYKHLKSSVYFHQVKIK